MVVALTTLDRFGKRGGPPAAAPARRFQGTQGIMRLTLEISRPAGAIPGLSRTLTVQTTSLPADARQQIESLAADPTIFAAAAPPATVRTARRYALTVDDGTRRRAVRFSDPVADARLRTLRDLVSGHGTPGPAPARYGTDDAAAQPGENDTPTLYVS